MRPPHVHADYWSRGLFEVPTVTGAAAVMDCRDLLPVLAEFGVPVPVRGSVLDIGCGSGRMAAHCAGAYVGLDISPDCVEYCRRSGLEAHLIGQDDIAAIRTGRFDWLFCFSVFTHMGREERLLYLRELPRLGSQLVADIIPGTGAGDVALWTADEAEFRRDAETQGWDILASTDRQPPTGDWTHRYFRMEWHP
jgi:SAM-dependent methyltransferase